MTAAKSTDSAAGEVLVPKNWYLDGPGWQNYVFQSSASPVHEGHASAALIAANSARDCVEPHACFADFVQISLAGSFSGHRLRFSGYLRTLFESSAPFTSASLWLRIEDANGLVIAFQNLAGRSVPNNTDWAKYDIVMDVPDNAAVMFYGAYVNSPGSLWADDLNFEVVNGSVALTKPPIIPGTIVPFDAGRAFVVPINLGFEETERRPRPIVRPRD